MVAFQVSGANSLAFLVKTVYSLNVRHRRSGGAERFFKLVVTRIFLKYKQLFCSC